MSSGAHTLSARGDNQRGATGQPTRWSALHLVHSAGSHSIGPCLRALAGNTMQGRSWRWRRWWWRRRAAAGGAIHGAILISRSLVIVKGPRAGNILRIFHFSIQVPVDHENLQKTAYFSPLFTASGKKKKMLSLDSCLKAMLCWSIHVWKGILTRRWRGGLSSRGECCAHLAGRASSAPCRGAGQQFKNQLGPPSIT